MSIAFIVGMIVGGVVQAFAEGIFKSLNSNKVYRCEGPGCTELALPDNRVRTKKGSGPWHHFHSADCAIAYGELSP
jgi:hypothetical protein